MWQAAPNAQIQQSAVAMIYASFWRRAVASVVDSLLIGVGLCVFLNVFAGAMASGEGGAFLIVSSLIPWVYKISLEAGGATLGKSLLGVRVVNRDGEVPGPKRAAIRSLLPMALSLPWVFAEMLIETADSKLIQDYAVEAVILLGILLLSGFVVGMIDVLWVTWDGHNQALRDKIARTYVVMSDRGHP